MSAFPKVHDLYVGRVVLGTVLATWAVLLGLDFIIGGLMAELGDVGQGNYGFGSGTDTHSLGIWAKAYGQVDASFSYALTPSLKLTVEGVNLNKEASKAYLQFPDLPLRYATGDQRIMLGVRYNFGG